MISVKNGSFAFFVFAVFFFGVYLFYATDYANLPVFDHFQNFSIPKTKENFEKSKELPLILAATSFFSGKLFETAFLKNSIQNCPFECTYTDDKSLYEIANVAVFHSRNFNGENYAKHFSSSNFSNPDRLNVFFSLESSPYEDITAKGYPKDFFNVSLTFRKDSHVWIPYDRFERIDNETSSEELWTDKQVEAAMKKKSKLAVQFVSNCATNSRREHYLRKLLRQANVTVHGKCSHNPCRNASCLEDEIEKHFFYLAFENSVCQDYVTEKFWRIKGLIVPIVLKRSVLKGIVDNEYFLAADDFDSPKELAEKMRFLAKNPREYKKFLNWTKHYKKVPTSRNELCRICQMAHNHERHQIDDIGQWWNRQSSCLPKFAANL